MAHKEQLDMILIGSAFEQVFGSTVLVPASLDGKLSVEPFSGFGGVRVCGTVHGLELPKTTSSKSSKGLESPSCILYVATSYENDFDKFASVISEYDGWVFLIARDDSNQDKWAVAMKDKSKLFQMRRPATPVEAQEFIGNAVQSVIITENLKAAQLAF